jgi:cell division septum initiation protein DivIVA
MQGPQSRSGTQTMNGPGKSSGEATADRAKQEAEHVADRAKQEGRHVTETAKQDAGMVADRAKQEARHLAEEARSQGTDIAHKAMTHVQEELRSQADRAAGWVRGLAQEADALAEGKPQQAEHLTKFSRKAGDVLDRIASQVASKDPAELMDEVKRFARRKPGAFLLGATALGFFSGRMGRDLRSGGGGGDGQRREPTIQPTGTRSVGTAMTGGVAQGTGTSAIPPHTSPANPEAELEVEVETRSAHDLPTQGETIAIERDDVRESLAERMGENR